MRERERVREREREREFFRDLVSKVIFFPHNAQNVAPKALWLVTPCRSPQIQTKLAAQAARPGNNY